MVPALKTTANPYICNESVDKIGPHRGECEMAARKSVLKRAPERPELEALLHSARQTGVSDEQLQEQRASFAYGNAPAGADRITKESARDASRRNRLIHI